MNEKFETLQDGIDRMVTGLIGHDAGVKSRRKVRMFLGVAGIIIANIWAGPVIGHGIAALLGAGVFFVVGLGGRETCGEDK